MSGRRVLVTGGRGYLGGRLLRDLPGAEPLIGDVTDRDGIARALAHAGPVDALIHLAAADEKTCAADPARAFAVNCVGTAHVLDAAIAALPGILAIAWAFERWRALRVPMVVLGIAAINGIRFREAKVGMRHTDLLEAEYRRWAERLADCLGCPLYPYSRKVAGGRGPGSIVRVRS